jgi:hypothetical protein
MVLTNLTHPVVSISEINVIVNLSILLQIFQKVEFINENQKLRQNASPYGNFFELSNGKPCENI